MKVELKQIIEQLTDVICLKKGYKVSSMIDENGDIKGWCIVKVRKEGELEVIEPLKDENGHIIRSYKDLKMLFKYEYKQSQL